MSAIPAPSAQKALGESVASMNDRQLALAASAIGISKPLLLAFAEGRTALSPLSLRRLGEHVYSGRYMEKVTS
jgi:hypothetical protein